MASIDPSANIEEMLRLKQFALVPVKFANIDYCDLFFHIEEQQLTTGNTWVKKRKGNAAFLFLGS